MTLHRRDDNEREIVSTLRACGATVHRLDGAAGLPDLLVGFRGVTYLLEVKAEHGRSGKGARKTRSGLRETQEAWHWTWNGRPVVVVTDSAEALVAIDCTLIGGG